MVLERDQRRILRQRGAGTRDLKNANFGFSFGGFTAGADIVDLNEAVREPAVSSETAVEAGHDEANEGGGRDTARPDGLRDETTTPLQPRLQDVNLPTRLTISDLAALQSPPSGAENSVPERRRSSRLSKALARTDDTDDTRQSLRSSRLGPAEQTLPDSSDATVEASQLGRLQSSATHVSDSQKSLDEDGDVGEDDLDDEIGANGDASGLIEHQAEWSIADATVDWSSPALRPARLTSSVLSARTEALVDSSVLLDRDPLSSDAALARPPSPAPLNRRQTLPVSAATRDNLPRPTTPVGSRKRRTVALPDPCRRQSKRLRARRSLEPPVAEEETPVEEQAAAEDDENTIGAPAEAESDGRTITINSFRVRTEAKDYHADRAITPVEVLAQIAAECSRRLIGSIHNSSRSGSASARARKVGFGHQFDLAVQSALLELSEAHLAGDIIESRLRTARATLAAKRREIIAIRADSRAVQVDLDRVRAEHIDRASRADAIQALATDWDSVVAAFSAPPSGPPDPDSTAAETTGDVVERTSRIASTVAGTTSGLLGRLRSFNQLLSGTLATISGRGK